MDANTNSSVTSYFSRNQKRRVVITGLVCLAFGLITILFSSRFPFNGVLIPLVLLVGALILRWPALGLCLMLCVVLICEVFITPEGITNFTSLPLTNINFITTLPLSATWLEIIIFWTIFSTVVNTLIKGEKVLHRWPLSIAAVLLGLNIFFSYVWGAFLKHGNQQAALWEVRSLIYIIVLYFLTVLLVESEWVFKAINWIFPLCTFVLCVISFWRFMNPDVMDTGGPHYQESLNGFNHEDAVIFVICVMWCLHKILFNGTVVEKLAAWLLITPALAAVFISGRRAAFASMAACFFVLLILLFVRRRKAFIVTVVLMAIVLPPYLIVFRNVDGPLGLAARAFSSGSGSNEVGSRDYNSDLYRVIEKSNVQLTIKQSPLTGIGFGQEFTRYTPMIEIDVFTFQNYTPHVQVLWMWLKLGMMGWMTFWFMVCGAFFRMSQIIKYEVDRSRINLAVLSGFILSGFMVFAYVDISLGSVRVCTLIGMSIGILELSFQKLKRPQNEALPELEPPVTKKELVGVST